MKISKAYAILFLLLASTFNKTSFAYECIDPPLLKNAKQSLAGFFSNPVSLSGDSRFPFLGLVLTSNCSKQHASCQVLFETKETFFEFQLVMGETFGITEKKIQDVSVTFTGVNGTQFPVGSEWFVIPGHYGSSDGHGQGFVFDTSCGSSLAQHDDGNLLMLNGDAIPYADVKHSLSEMINPEAIERLKNALLEMTMNKK